MTDFDNSFLAEDDSTTAHEDALVFEVGGNKLGWKPSGLALKRASDQGVEAGDILRSFQDTFGADLDEEDLDEMDEEELAEKVGGTLSGLMTTVATLVWLGALHFEPNATRESVLAILDPSDVEDIPMDRMLDRIWPHLTDVQIEESEGK